MVTSGPWDLHRPCRASHCPGREGGCVHHLLLLGRAALVPGACWEPPASGEASGQMPGKEKHNNLEQVQNTCPKKHHQVLPGGPCEPSPLLCPWREVGRVPSALLSSFQDPRPARERAGTFLCWAEQSSALSSGAALPRCLPATSGINSHIWLEPAEPGLAGRSSRPVASAEGTALAGAWQPHLPAWLLHAGGRFLPPCSGRSSQAPYPELCRACFPPSLPLWGSLASWYYFRSLRPEENWRLDQAWLKGGL